MNQKETIKLTMIKSKLKTVVPGLLILGMMVLPSQLFAQITNKTAAEKRPTTETKEPSKTEKKSSAGPFHGKLAAMDKIAKTITVGKRTFQITSETKIKKAGKFATLEDGVVGEDVSGYVKPSAADGKLVATTVNFGPKTDTKAADKKASPEKK
jgi:hypothetical protein